MVVLYGCKCRSFVAFVVVVVVVMSTHLLYKLVQDLLGDISTLAPWNVLFIRVLFICKLYSGMELAHLEVFISIHGDSSCSSLI